MAATKYAPRDVAVVIPLSTRDSFTSAEELSLRHADAYLGNYRRYLVCPEGNPISRIGYERMEFPGGYFGSVRAHNTLMLSRFFYERFAHYSFLLIYHLDSLVFADELMFWCEKDYDYIGAPWILTKELPWVKTEGVGNGGFSLRKVQSFLAVLKSKVNWRDYDQYWKGLGTQGRRWRQALLLPKWLLKNNGYRNRVQHHIADHIRRDRNEDRFWGLEAQEYLATFKIAPVEEALRFAFESDPELCLRRTGDKLPFGCHAWERYAQFWHPHLLGMAE